MSRSQSVSVRAGVPGAPPPAPVPRSRAAVPGLLGATALSTSGNAMIAVLIPWLVLSRTGSPGLAGLVSAAATAAMVPALLLGGALMDRWPRRTLSIAADLRSAVAVVALPLFDVTFGLTVVGIAALVAVGAAFDGPGAAARESLRPDMAIASAVPIERVNAHGEVMQEIGNVGGPALGGAGIAVLGLHGSL